MNDIPTSVREVSSSVPSGFRVYQNFPNPFNPDTHIRFDTPRAGHADLKIYDIKGSLVKTDEAVVSAGSHEFDEFMHNLASGVYIYQVSFDGENIGTGKMVMAKGYGHSQLSVQITAPSNSFHKDAASRSLWLYVSKDGFKKDSALVTVNDNQTTRLGFCY